MIKKIIFFAKISSIMIVLFIVWINIPLFYPKLVNNNLFTLGYFHEIPDEYKFLQKDRDDFKILNLKFISEKLLTLDESEAFKYFYKKDHLNKYQAEIFLGRLPIDINKLIDKHIFIELGEHNVKYVLIHFSNNINTNKYLDNLDKFGFAFHYPKCLIIKNNFFKKPNDILAMSKLYCFLGKYEDLDLKLLESLTISNFELIFKDSDILCDLNSLQKLNYIVPISLSNVNSCKSKYKYEAFFQPYVNEFNLKNISNNFVNIKFYVTNIGNKTWFPNENVNISYHIFDENKNLLIFDGLRTELKKPVIPGDKVMVELRVLLPEDRIRFFITPDLVKENEFWFSQLRDNIEVDSLIFELIKKNDLVEVKAHGIGNMRRNEDIFVSYTVNIPEQGFYYLLADELVSHCNDDIQIFVNDQLVKKNNTYLNSKFDGFNVINEFKLMKGFNSITLRNLNFLKNSGGIREAEYLYLVSVNNENYVPKFKIIGKKYDNKGYLRKLTLKTEESILLKLKLDNTFHYKLICNSFDVILLKSVKNNYLLFIKSGGLHDLVFSKEFRIQKTATTYSEYLFYEN